MRNSLRMMARCPPPWTAASSESAPAHPCSPTRPPRLGSHVHRCVPPHLLRYQYMPVRMEISPAELPGVPINWRTTDKLGELECGPTAALDTSGQFRVDTDLKAVL
ncbi:hypothetical protein BD309DRAFT_963511 [Dichomitus squalens]|uniref:Uncharacterized protein n=1 Tax=Dichomitus squalens TaxID=114155 RepID=A0A4Q9PJS4_9APHY|nr:hypothetical protein BD309DRAFT_963511 [Dichomitus squalens]TBU54370.1 hypothetical protein BD310DRAFT_935997 [Dichomitus squalens]